MHGIPRRFKGNEGNRAVHLQPTPPPENARVIDGRYLLGEKLGAGAQSVIYEARHLVTKQAVALKIVACDGLHDEELRARFFREVRLISSLDHPAIVKVYDAGYVNPTTPFYAMERLYGQTFEEWLADGPQDVDLIVEVVEEVARALAHAHRRGVLHRDVKPANIFLAEDESGDVQVTLLDFGLGFMETDAHVTQEGIAVGTPYYMSPEQALAPEEVDATSDVWALGVVLYEAISGRVPFRADTLMQTLVAVCRTPQKPLSEICPRTPPRLNELVQCCLDKHPARRPQNASEFLVRMRTAMAPEPKRTTSSVRVVAQPVERLYAPTPTPAPGPTTAERQRLPPAYARTMTSARKTAPRALHVPMRLALMCLAGCLLSVQPVTSEPAPSPAAPILATTPDVVRPADFPWMGPPLPSAREMKAAARRTRVRVRKEARAQARKARRAKAKRARRGKARAKR
jgi:eukaryotic-like serine/threonine-protein kinase